mmetsp:Transcript_11951/g.36886  ORF Transcript_11951/g.36886 Transcript_11951/m.36886 type:complete len:444 (+) Transcript_11951:557-1888(+)
MTSPSDMASTAAFTASVALQAGAHLMSLLISSVIHFAAGISENFSLDPFFGRPKCEQTDTLAPLLQRYSIVGMEAMMRSTSVISRSPVGGTLRSQRKSTLMPFKSDSPRSSPGMCIPAPAIVAALGAAPGAAVVGPGPGAPSPPAAARGCSAGARQFPFFFFSCMWPRSATERSSPSSEAGRGVASVGKEATPPSSPAATKPAGSGEPGAACTSSSCSPQSASALRARGRGRARSGLQSLATSGLRCLSGVGGSRARAESSDFGWRSVASVSSCSSFASASRRSASSCWASCGSSSASRPSRSVTTSAASATSGCACRLRALDSLPTRAASRCPASPLLLRMPLRSGTARRWAWPTAVAAAASTSSRRSSARASPRGQGWAVPDCWPWTAPRAAAATRAAAALVGCPVLAAASAAAKTACAIGRESTSVNVLPPALSAMASVP